MKHLMDILQCTLFSLKTLRITKCHSFQNLASVSKLRHKYNSAKKQRYHHVIITVTTHGLKFQFLPSDDIGKKIPSRDKSDAALLFANWSIVEGNIEMSEQKRYWLYSITQALKFLFREILEEQIGWKHAKLKEIRWLEMASSLKVLNFSIQSFNFLIQQGLGCNLQFKFEF